MENGDRYVIEHMRKKDYNLGGEASGHIIFSDYNSTGDGTIAALQLIRFLIQSRSKLSEHLLEKFPQVNLAVEVAEKKPLENLENVQKIIDSVKKDLDGRLLVRYSGTQDVARIMIEGKGDIMKYATKIAEAIRSEVGK